MPSYAIVATARERQLLTLDALARRAGMHPAFVEQMIEFGLIVPSGRQAANLLFEPSALIRLRTINRLRESLGINLAGISVILDLLDRMRRVR
ncbi:MAG: chaperone-modulator protein CbpM [Bryobacterales bacterium]|nr:chaperone-modulator protein CbpM [Bryobacterales bacterium]